MAKIIENDCVGCPQGCGHCGARHTPHYYCDKCDDEFDGDELVRYDGKDLCKDCLFDEFATLDNVQD